MPRSRPQDPGPFFPGGRHSGAAASSTDSSCLAHPCASMLVGRPADTSDKVSVAAIIMIVMSVLSRCACTSASATASSRRASRAARRAGTFQPIRPRCARWCAAPRASAPRPRVACCSLPPLGKMAAAAAPPARLSLCSQTLSERAEHFVLVAKEGPERERRHERASACPRSDTVGLVMRGPCERLTRGS